MKLLVRFACFFLALAGTALAAPELSPQERTGLLARIDAIHARVPSLQADFSEQKTSRLLAKPLLTDGTIVFQVPNKFRREIKGQNPSLTVSNGKQLWMYYPNFKEAELYVLGQRQAFDDHLAALTAGLNFQRVDEFYSLRASREEAGYRCDLVPRRASLRRVLEALTIWIDDNLHVLKSEITLPKGERVLTTYRNFRRAPVPAATFEFTPPPDVNVSRPLGR